MKKGGLILSSHFETDIVVIGAGNAAMCAAIAARENGANVMVLKNPQKQKKAVTVLIRMDRLFCL